MPLHHSQRFHCAAELHGAKAAIQLAALAPLLEGFQFLHPPQRGQHRGQVGQRLVGDLFAEPVGKPLAFLKRFPPAGQGQTKPAAGAIV